MKINRAENLHFHRYDDTIIVAPPVTRAQMREILAIDRVPAESLLDQEARRGLQIEVFLRDASWLQRDPESGEIARDKDGKPISAGSISEALGKLTADEEIDIIHAFVAQHHGLPVTTSVEMQQALREILKKKMKSQKASPAKSLPSMTK